MGLSTGNPNARGRMPGRASRAAVLIAVTIGAGVMATVQAQQSPPEVLLSTGVDEVGLGGAIPHELRISEGGQFDILDVRGQVPAPDFASIASGLSCQSVVDGQLQPCSGFSQTCGPEACEFELALDFQAVAVIEYTTRVATSIPLEVAEIVAEAVVQFPQLETSTTVTAATPLFRTPPDLATSVTDGNVAAITGRPLVWRIDYFNQGQQVAEEARLLATVPQHSRFDPELSDAWVCAADGAAGRECRLDLGTIGPGEAGSARFAVRVDADPDEDAREVVNRVEIVFADSDSIDPEPVNNVASDRASILRNPGLMLPRIERAAAGSRSAFGVEPGQRLGQGVSRAGDLNGDGHADAMVSAPGTDEVLLVLGGPLEAALAPFPVSEFPSIDLAGFIAAGDDGFGGLGDRLAALGDANGDGLDDVGYADAAVAFNILTGRIRGAFIQPGFAMPPGFVFDQQGRFAPEDSIELVTAAAAGPFATELAGLGDVNADGLGDYAVAFDFGSPRSSQATVFAIFGEPSLEAFQPETRVVEDAAAGNGLRLTNAQAPESRFGHSVTGVGDFNGDGIDDFAVAAPAQGNGAVFVVFGDPELRQQGEGFLDAGILDGGNGFALFGGEGSTEFGNLVAAAGDFNGDGLDDIVVGEPASDGRAGRIHLVHGTAGSVPDRLNMDDPAPLMTATLEGIAPGDDFGLSAAGAGDIDGDGLDDLVIGAPGLAEAVEPGMAVPNTGTLFVVFGRNMLATGSSVADLVPSGAYSIRAPESGIGFGTSVAGLGDFSGDGIPDLVVSAPDATADGLQSAGQFWVVSGALRPDPVGTNIEIGEFDVSPDVLFVGNSVEIAWTVAPDDAATACIGSGLPGTGWDATELPATGTRQVDTSPLAPGTYSPTLTCTRNEVTVDAEATLEVLDPPVQLTLAGSRTGLRFFGDSFVQAEVTNTSSQPANAVVLELTPPPGYQGVAIFRRAGSCTAGETGEVACDAGSIPDWQCASGADGFSCQLESLPAQAVAGVVVQLRGEGPGQLVARADAVNSLPEAINIPLLD